MRRFLTALTLVATLAAAPACSSPEVAQVEQGLAQVDAKADEAEAQGEVDYAAQLRALEAEYRARLAETAAGEGVRSGDAALDALSRGDILAALGALGLGSLVFRRKMLNLAAELHADLEALERRRDESRSLQGIAPATARSVAQTASPVARAAAASTGAPTASTALATLPPQPTENA